MKKLAIGSCAATMLLALMLPAAAGSSRVETQPYDSPTGFSIAGQVNLHILTDGTTYTSFHAAPGERFVTFSIEDASGQAPLGHIHMDANRDGETDVVEDFCGTSPKLKVRPGTHIEVGVLGGACPDGTPAIATSGQVVANFSGN